MFRSIFNTNTCFAYSHCTIVGNHRLLLKYSAQSRKQDRPFWTNFQNYQEVLLLGDFSTSCLIWRKKNGKNWSQKYFLSLKKKESSSVHIRKNYSSREKNPPSPEMEFLRWKWGRCQLETEFPFLKINSFFLIFTQPSFFQEWDRCQLETEFWKSNSSLSPFKLRTNLSNGYQYR